MSDARVRLEWTVAAGRALLMAVVALGLDWGAVAAQAGAVGRAQPLWQQSLTFERALRTDSGTDFRPFLSRRGIGILASLGAAAWASKTFEDADRMARNLDGSPFDAVFDLGDRYGDGLSMGLGALGLMLTGQACGDRRLQALGSDMTRALLVSWGIVWALKVGVDAERPNGGSYSFPSGHTATAFAVAPVIGEHWGWQAGVAAHAVAVSTALARMEDRRHYLADVLFGAAIGLAVGYQVVSDDGLPGFLTHITATPRSLGYLVRF